MKSCIIIGNKLNFNLVSFNCHTHHIMSSVNRQICTVHNTRARANHIKRHWLNDTVETITCGYKIVILLWNVQKRVFGFSQNIFGKVQNVTNNSHKLRIIRIYFKDYRNWRQTLHFDVPKQNFFQLKPCKHATGLSNTTNKNKKNTKC